MSRVSISLKTANLCRDILVPDRITNGAIRELESAIAHATRVRPGLKKAEKVRGQKKRAKAAGTKGIRAAVMLRANGLCELCQMGPADELHHVFGRVRQRQSEINCLGICRGCHFNVTHSIPTAVYWVDRQADVFERLGFLANAKELRAKIPKLELRAKSRGAT